MKFDERNEILLPTWTIRVILHGYIIELQRVNEAYFEHHFQNELKIMQIYNHLLCIQAVVILEPVLFLQKSTQDVPMLNLSYLIHGYLPMF